MKSVQEMFHEAVSVEDDANHQIKIERFNILLQTYPDFAPAHDHLGSIYYHIGNFKAALEHFENAALIEPDNISFQKNLGDFYHTILSRNEDALICYRKILAILPNDAEINLIAANLLVALHRFDEAEKLYENLLTIEPWRIDIQELITKIRSRKGKNKIEYCNDRYQQAQKLAELNDKKGAIKVLLQIVADDPQNALAHNDLGVLRYQIGEVKEAQNHYERAVALDADNIVFKKNLAEYYLFENNEIKKALELYLSILKDYPFDIETLTISAHISIKLGLIDNARVFCEAILDIEPWNMEASEWLAEINRKNNPSKTQITIN